MITHLRIRNFKSHADTALRLSNLSVICGQNGVGKSSVFQSLLALRQSQLKNRLREGLDLNKPLCELGTALDVLHQFAQEEQIGISVEADGRLFEWGFAFDSSYAGATFIPAAASIPAALPSLALFNEHFQYLSAYRLPPQESYPRDDYEVQRNRQISIEKGKGELVAHFLQYYGGDQISFPNLLNPGSPFSELLAQTTAWEREISTHIHVVVYDTGRGFELKYKYDVPNALPTNEFRAENVGFGITYTLPLIVAMLAAKPGSLLLFENPEAHLHPQSQSKLAELMCRCAQNGVQILVETHSDHILNGILVACKRFEQDGQGIDRDLVRIHYFDRDDYTHSTRATEIQVLPGGKIDRQPGGFFDQIEKDMRTILGF
ncbi:MAG: DUF3696 domain-containing protein [Bacteroidia bacterium]|nr:DUF3696 domain-containing protein [Bacteroidia bacterium]